jgi:hypothetical protein
MLYWLHRLGDKIMRIKEEKMEITWWMRERLPLPVLLISADYS